MSGFTPGPYKILYGPSHADGFSIGTNNAAASRVKVVCECWPCTIIDKEHRDELQANADLFCASPDLLAACEKMVSRADEAGWHQELLEEARAAIAKALGKGEGS